MKTKAPALCVVLLTTAAAIVAACSGGSAAVTDPNAAGADAGKESEPSSDGSIDGTTEAGDAQAVPSAAALGDALAAAGLDSKPGKLAFFDLSQCCQSSAGCFANNPSSPYAGIWLPPGPGQTAANPEVISPSSDGTAAAWRLRPDEAVVFVGATPPEAKYFGFTHYIYDREVDGARKSIFASLGESTNSATIGVVGGGAPFEKPTALVLTADKGTEAKVRTVLTAQGIPASAINAMVFDPAEYKPGLEQDKDTFALLLRLAEVKDETKRAAYLAKPGGTVLRVSPKVVPAPSPETRPASRPKNLTITEASLASSLDALENAIRATRPMGYLITKRNLIDLTPDPVACNTDDKGCLGDSRDTTYPSTIPFPFLDDPEDLIYVMGPNHAATGKATYSSFAIEAVDHLVGVAAVTNASFAGSANVFLPGNADAAKLYAWKVARSCAAGEPYCLAVPAGTGCPTGVPAGGPVLVFARTYLEPGTGTAPDISTLQLDRVLVFHKLR